MMRVLEMEGTVTDVFVGGADADGDDMYTAEFTTVFGDDSDELFFLDWLDAEQASKMQPGKRYRVIVEEIE